MMGDLFVLAISSIFINNILLAQYLGNCPFFGTSKKMETAIGMGMAVIFVLVMSGVTTWLVSTFFLVKYNLEYLQTLAFILVIASLVQFVEMFLKKSIPALYSGLGIFLPLITTNCAVLGVCLILINAEYNFIQAVVASFSYAVGYAMALILFAAMRERILIARVPRPLQDTSIALVTAGIISLTFFAFKGMV
jgi:electron transport complex protein RnfA